MRWKDFAGIEYEGMACGLCPFSMGDFDEPEVKGCEAASKGCYKGRV
jgi:hypothetical protein